MLRTVVISSCLTLGSLGFALGTSALADETVLEKTQNVGNKAVDSVKETGRDVKDKTCEMVNGKMECLPKKIKNKTKTAVDKTETKAKQIKNKVD